MLDRLSLNLTMLAEKAKSDGFFKSFSQAVYHRQKAVPAFRDLATMKPERHPLSEFGCTLIEISREDPGPPLEYALKSRKMKVPINFAGGFRSFVMIRENKVVGDIWYVPGSADNPRPCDDLELLGIDIKPDEVYAFDMFVPQEARGKDLTTTFMGSVLRRLRDMGYTKAYGYYMADNVPALWIHRLIGYKEMPVVEFRRILGSRSSRPVPAKQG